MLNPDRDSPPMLTVAQVDTFFSTDPDDATVATAAEVDDERSADINHLEVLSSKANAHLESLSID